MIRCDIHTHAFHPKISAKVLLQLEGHYGIPATGNGQIEDLLQRIAEAGLDQVVVHNAATTPDQVIPANNWACHLQGGYYPRVLTFGTVHPDFPRWPEELDRLEQAGVTGIKIHPDFQGVALDAPGMLPIFEALQGRFLCMVHVGDKRSPQENPSSPQRLAAVHKDFPGLTLIGAHFGGYLHWEQVIEHLLGLDIYLDTSSSLSFIQQRQLETIWRGHPRERFLFGSDYPLFDPGQELGLLQRRLGLWDQDLELLWRNAQQLLQINTHPGMSPKQRQRVRT